MLKERVTIDGNIKLINHYLDSTEGINTKYGFLRITGVITELCRHNDNCLISGMWELKMKVMFKSDWNSGKAAWLITMAIVLDSIYISKQF